MQICIFEDIIIIWHANLYLSTYNNHLACKFIFYKYSVIFGNFSGETPSKFKILNEKRKTAYDCDHDQQ